LDAEPVFNGILSWDVPRLIPNLSLVLVLFLTFVSAPAPIKLTGGAVIIGAAGGGAGGAGGAGGGV
tara:strand:- start:642 stop:839 length:198 start_codon:yes stop_codon:yes gene_type:complete